MRTYSVEITETLRRTIVIEALSDEEALLKVKEQYDEEEIVLDSSDYAGTEFVAQLEN